MFRLPPHRSRLAGPPATSAEELERERIARELTNGVIQQLAGLSYAIEAEERHGPADARALLAPARAILEDSLRALHGIAGTVRMPDLERIGLPEALARLADPLATNGSELRLRLDDAHGLSAGQALAAYRVAREALANIRQHAPGAAGAVVLAPAGRGAVLTVGDQGPGFDPAAPAVRGLGLRIMETAAAAAGARLRIASRPGTGTRVTLALPVPGR